MKLKRLYGGNWTKPDLTTESGELERTSADLNVPLDNLVSVVASGSLIALNNSLWSRLLNSDSYEVTATAARRLAVTYSRDLDRILVGLRHGDQIPAPIVIQTKAGPYLVAGNTRLMAARISGIRPKIWFATLADPPNIPGRT